MTSTPSLAQQIIDLLTANKLTIGFAESLTGGMLADQIISIPGASAVMAGSLVTYAPETKTSVLGVSANLIARHSVFNPHVATAMAQGALTVLGCDIAIATTGVAGPEAQDGHAVGEVYLGFAQRPGLDLFDPEETLALDLGVLATGDPLHTRLIIRQATVRAALGLLAARLDQSASDR